MARAGLVGVDRPESARAAPSTHGAGQRSRPPLPPGRKAELQMRAAAGCSSLKIWKHEGMDGTGIDCSDRWVGPGGAPSNKETRVL